MEDCSKFVAKRCLFKCTHIKLLLHICRKINFWFLFSFNHYSHYNPGKLINIHEPFQKESKLLSIEYLRKCVILLGTNWLVWNCRFRDGDAKISRAWKFDWGWQTPFFSSKTLGKYVLYIILDTKSPCAIVYNYRYV